jgi:hypothetical protein
VFSAAFIAHVEASYPAEAIKNELCTPVPHPDSDVDFMRSTLTNMINGVRWGQDEALQHWLKNARLDGFTLPGDGAPDPETAQKMSEYGMGTVQKLQKYLAQLEA